jgi:hypothetical protein
MTALDILLAVAGFTATALVVAGMILITPRGQVDVDDADAGAQGENLSPTRAPDAQRPVPAPS